MKDGQSDYTAQICQDPLTKAVIPNGMEIVYRHNIGPENHPDVG